MNPRPNPLRPFHTLPNTEMDTQNAKEIEIWNEGRRELTVTHADSTTEVVVVGKVPLLKQPQLMAAQGKDEPLVDLYLEATRRDRAWFDGLDVDSQFEFVEKAGDVNAPLLKRWLDSKRKVLARSGLDLDDIIAKAVQKRLDQGASSPSAAS